MNQPHTIRLSSWARLVGLALLLGVGVLASLGLATRMAHAQSLNTVTITDCTDDSQLQSAIANAASGDTINFGCKGTITLSQTLVISKNLTLDGSGQQVTLSGGDSVRVLSVNPGVTFTLNALTIAHGSTTGGGGGLENKGTVSISNSTFANNSGLFGGGGLFNIGTVNITNSTFANNSAGNALGGGLENDSGTVTISNSTFANNSASQGGGIANNGSGLTVTISNSTFANNSAIGGGGLFNYGTVNISTSTFANNSAGSGGGGGLLNDGTVSISTSTFANNSSGGLGGGGLFNYFGMVNVTNSTFANNSAAGGSGLYNYGGTMSIGGSIVAANTGGDCSGSLTDQGYNLSSDSSCGFTGTGSLQNTDPRLDPGGLQNNGGPTQTIVLLSSSPAIDHIPAANCPATDQRGVTRLPGERCDIGAFEFPDTTPPTLHLPSPITVNATSPQGAVVSYTATATDDDGDTLVATCAPASGSTFPIGTTTVNCSASEPGSDTATGSFSVTVNGAATQVSDLMTTVNSMGLSSGLQNSLDVKLNAALKAVNAGQTATACSDLSDFIGEAQSQSGKGLTVSQANQLIAAATQVQAVLGC
jgi:hypothetical protein